eukprot:m.164461 g.164461  ORF g.164461 m.164461 type:complete len:874 (-) comp16580_c0_seq4:876-3497(-)
MTGANSTDWSYCGHGNAEYPMWQGGVISYCFLQTVSSLTLFFYAFIICGVAGAISPSKKRFRYPLSPSLGYIFNLAITTIALLHVAKTVYLSIHHGPIEVEIVTGCLHTTAWGFASMPISRAAKGRQPLHPVFVVYIIMATTFLALELTGLNSSTWYFSDLNSNLDHMMQTVVFIARGVLVALLFLLSAYQVIRRYASAAPSGYQHLSNGVGINSDDSASAAVSVPTAGKSSDSKPVAREAGSVEQRSGSTFDDVAYRVKVIWPFLWPKGQRLLQLRVIICVALLAVGRVVNLYVPLTYKHVIDVLTPNDSNNKGVDDTTGGQVPFPVMAILVYVGLRFLSGGGAGGMGLLNNFRSYLWIAVTQYTSRISRMDVFRHLHALSLRWHLSRKTGEVLRMVDRGTDSVNSLLSYILFNIAPTLIDIAIACVYFTSQFGPYFGLIVFATMMGYIYATIRVTEWRTKFRRSMNTQDNKLRQMAVDSLLNFETVKYYNGEAFELQRYDQKITAYLYHFWQSQASLNLLNSAQSIIIILGLLAGTLLCGYLVHIGRLTVGDFVLYVTYVVQLYSPLNFFGTYYRMIQANLIDLENMFDLLGLKPEVIDAPDAKPLSISPDSTGCSIEFKDVHFHYNNDKEVLKGVSFSVPDGSTLAIVGPSGSGKSTIMRLLFRFYDLQQGSILVNGQNVRAIQQDSLRRHMSVVPQDTVLFNDTISYNVEYGRPGATREEIMRAAAAAEIHDAILKFPQQYDTVVGERGLKLSGGEKQRVAIARAILKDPRIMLLDEATSALDTNTERSIQSSLHRVCKGRTTVTIAHRLSTIISADQILVLKDGMVAEVGSHDTLLAAEGVYAEMWRRQLEADEEIEAQVGMDLNKEA